MMNSRNGRRHNSRTWAAALAVSIAALCTIGPAPGHADSPPVPPLGGDFLWGVASSGFQSEGSEPDSNWLRHTTATAPDQVGNSVDFYHRYREDIGLAAGLGAKVYRISVEWARIQPRPGEWDEQGFAFYDNVIAAIRAAGMRPMITLDHWVYPGWVADRGGWADPAMVDEWLASARAVVDRYAGDDPLWVTINEPYDYPRLMVSQGQLRQDQIPMMYDRLVTAHDGIYDYIHARQPGAMVTSNASYLPGVETLTALAFENRIADKLDYVGIDYYYGEPPGSPALNNPPWRDPLQPEGIYYALRHYARQFPGKPLYVVENGMPTEDGKPRADGWTRADDLRDTAYWLQRARADGLDVIGYNYWSLTDNYEWGSYTPRFGLYTVDVTSDPSLTRHPTDAVSAYRDIIAAGGVPGDYALSHPTTPCSLVDPPFSCVQPVTGPVR
ncbi:glycoside hydrolase family 1 protein [Nocardia sp. alder85J]|uniref:glycoside hydrolase family 1 protein n=1 Tax=Nocardia sp. alder85J TaxID=2862949 RepID=UPI001CD71EEA|nr:family 1 glycosylhydrolase [Nocardia sp. alder85J]MCX4094168.1 family 1 glycosylhydrolase [Nocardia sp. alder85J]